MSIRFALLAAALSLCALPSARAERSISWDRLDVRAHLDATGRLHVAERHAMRFDGDWNGGERLFRVEPSQTLTVEGITRIDDSGEEHQLTRGDLVFVDHWQLDGKRLRWRAREVSDPPFDDKLLTYEIRYEIGGVLQPRGGDGRYRLAHDFAFPSRSGEIRELDVELSFDPAWNAKPIRSDAQSLRPGRSHVIITELQSSGEVTVESGGWYLPFVAAFRRWFLPLPAFAVLLFFFIAEQKRHRADSVNVPPIDRRWIEENVLRHSPEVAGALVDGEVGPEEVAGILAAMEKDGKVETELQGRKKSKDLHLTLLVDRNTLSDRERSLVDYLFGSVSSVNLRKVRESRRDEGFNPVAVIRRSVEREVRAIDPDLLASGKWNLVVPMLIAGLLALIAGMVQRNIELFLVMVLAIGAVVVFVMAHSISVAWKTRGDVVTAFRFLLPGAVFCILVIVAASILRNQDGEEMTFFSITGLGLLLGAFYLLITEGARSGLSRPAAEVRACMLRAREWIRDELKKERPSLDDGWMPWIVSLGLDDSLAQWWKRQESRPGPVRRDDDSLRTLSIDDRPSIFTGGGGRFGGAGASASWAAAATTLATPMAAAVASGSSGSSSDSSWSSSDSSSDSSSGGGGGGGW